MKDIGALMKQAQGMQQKLQDAQARLAETTVEGAAGGGLVRVTMKGSGELAAVAIDDSLLAPSEAEVVGDLIVAAHADARRHLEAATADEMGRATGGLNLPPGFKLPF
jgi:nucleoid-associated protein EbfC